MGGGRLARPSRRVQANLTRDWFTPGWAKPDRVRQHTTSNGLIVVVRPKVASAAAGQWQLLIGSRLLTEFSVTTVEEATAQADTYLSLYHRKEVP